MRYDIQSNRVVLDAGELVALSIAHLQIGVSFGDEALFGKRQEGGTALEVNCEADHLRYRVTAYAHKVSNEGITLSYRLPAGLRSPTEDIKKRARGEAFVAAYAQAVKCNADTMEVSLDFTGAGAPIEERETVSMATLSAFMTRMLHTLPQYHAAELDRACRRLPTMAKVKYPFSSLREGQQELIQEVYRSLAEGKRLYACAPTGIGKTISMLFPAVRGMGDGHFEKVFYFTPKNTVGEAVIQAVEQLKKAGAELYAVQILAKERICPNALACRGELPESCKLTPQRQKKMMEGALALLSQGNAVISPDDIKKEAMVKGVCPYELSLLVSELCDIVICDYNYLFDGRVFLKRYFTHGGKYCFLFDEAHNIPDRVAEGYSLSLTPEKLREMGEVLGFLEDLPSLFSAAAEGLWQHILKQTKENATTDKAGIPHGFAASKQAPEEVFAVLYALLSHVAAVLEEQRGKLPRAQRRKLQTVYYDLEDICRKIALYDRRYITFYDLEGEETKLEVLCLDPGEIVSQRLKMGHGAVFFSATLFPVDYYKSVLGGRKQDPTVELPSPFDPSHLCLTVMDKIATGYSTREGSLREVVRVILTTLKAKPGNYMVFCPSFAYMKAISDTVKKAVPGLDVLCQSPSMSEAEREQFLGAFSTENKKALLGFCVMGGIYSEGIDLTGKRLIGAIVVGVGLPTLSNLREAMREYYEEKYESGTAYAYTYPGMNRVMQAAGRVIRTENDRGVVVLIDQRFAEPVYKKLMPYWWHSLQYAGDTAALSRRLTSFWKPKEQ